MQPVSQTLFTDALLDPSQPAPAGLVDPQGRPAAARFDVYRNNVAVSLSNALAEAFPAVAKLLGENNFSILSGIFLRAHPPSSPVIAQYGSALPDFLAGFEQTKSMGYLPDVARIELAMRKSYHAADATPADLSALAALSPDDIAATRLEIAPSVQLLRSQWPALSVYTFTLQGGAKPEMRAEDTLILRAEFDPMPHLLPPGAASWIAAVAQGTSIGGAAQIAEAETDAFDLSATLGLLISGGAITALHTP